MDEDDVSDELHTFHVTISAPALTVFNYRGQIIKDYRWPFSSSITLVSFDCPYWGDEDRGDANSFYKLRRSLSLVECLRLSTNVVKVLTHAAELLIDLPIFKNLNSLAFVEEFIDLGCGVLQMILEKCMLLETLILST